MTHPNREGRERAVELLYEAEAKGVHPAEVIASLPIPPVPYAASLATGVGDHVELLDHLIGARARNWVVERMPAVDRALLRLGAYELAFEPEQPEGVVLSEAVELATRFSTDESPAFVNGLLAALVEDVRGGGSWRNVCCPAALLVDMDGVIRYWTGDAARRADGSLGLAPGTFASIALSEESVRRGNDGTLTDEEWRAEVAARVAEVAGCSPEEVSSLWRGDDFTIDADVVDLVRAVRSRSIPTACVSNATTRLVADLSEHGLADAFTAVVSSSEVGAMKPDPVIYRAAAEAVGVPVGDCLFVDDRVGNVLGALEVGMPAVRFTGPVRLHATLQRVGLLV